MEMLRPYGIAQTIRQHTDSITMHRQYGYG